MAGTSTYIWHDAKNRYDEVAWNPQIVTQQQAEAEAEKRFSIDRRATRIQIDVADRTIVDLARDFAN